MGLPPLVWMWRLITAPLSSILPGMGQLSHRGPHFSSRGNLFFIPRVLHYALWCLLCSSVLVFDRNDGSPSGHSLARYVGGGQSMSYAVPASCDVWAPTVTTRWICYLPVTTDLHLIPIMISFMRKVCHLWALFCSTGWSRHIGGGGWGWGGWC